MERFQIAFAFASRINLAKSPLKVFGKGENQSFLLVQGATSAVRHRFVVSYNAQPYLTVAKAGPE